MSALLQGRAIGGVIRFTDGAAAPHHFHNGLPFDPDGGIAIADGGVIDHFHQGLPFTANGRLVSVQGSVNYWGSGAAPFNNDPSLVRASVVDHYSSGVPYSPGGSISFGTVPLNALANSSWLGASGSVSGADFVFPEGWAGGFWPPDEAVATDVDDYTQIQFITNANRGYVSFDLGSFPVGTILNASIFLEECITSDAQRIILVNGPVNQIRRVQNVSGGESGRFDSLYEVTGAGTVSLRVGAGTSANSTQNITLSRPQVTEGETLWPYQRTLPQPIFQDNFVGIAGTDLVNHTPSIGGPWTSLGGVLQLTGSGGCTPAGTGTGTGAPNYWSRLTNVTSATPKLIRWRATDFGDGTSLTSGITVLTSADGNNKVTVGLRSVGLCFQEFQTGAISNTELLTNVGKPGAGNEYPQPFFAIVNGTEVTYGYGEWDNPVFEATRDFSALTGLGNGIGIIGRATNVNVISELSCRNW